MRGRQPQETLCRELKRTSLRIDFLGCLVGCMLWFSAWPLPRAAALPSSGNSKESLRFDPQVIYGLDERREAFEAESQHRGLQELAASTLALIQSQDLSARADGLLTLHAATAQKIYRLCPGEKFAEQKSAAFCTGSLIGPDLILTAGHCLPFKASCDATSFVFDYRLQSPLDPLDTLKPEQVYSCKDLLYTQIESDGDFAIVRLDRPVVDRRPLQLRPRGRANAGDDVFVLGHPLGVPMKYSDSSSIRSVRGGFFKADLDVFDGNSGSPVFGSQSGVVEGVLVSGEQDFDRKGSCYVARQCPQNACRGEEATDVARVRAILHDLRIDAF